MPLNRLHDGIILDDFGVTIPWLITEPDLYRIVPETVFTRSVAGWPMLPCTVLGIDLIWGFNFVTDPETRFIGLRYDNRDSETSKNTFSRSSARLLTALGTPNRVHMPNSHLRWEDDAVCVDSSIRTTVESDGREVPRHSLFIYAIRRIRAGTT